MESRYDDPAMSEVQAELKAELARLQDRYGVPAE